MTPSTPCRSVRASADSTSASDSPSPTPEPSAMPKSTPTAPPNSAATSPAAPSPTPLSSPTCAPWTDARGVDSWIASLRATRANHSASPVVAVDQTILGTCGPISLASLAKSLRLCVFSRTCPATSLWDSQRSPVTLKKWATQCRRAFAALSTLAPPTAANASLSSQWRTIHCPSAHDSNRSALSGRIKQRGIGHDSREFATAEYEVTPNQHLRNIEPLSSQTASREPITNYPESYPAASLLTPSERSSLLKSLSAATGAMLAAVPPNSGRLNTVFVEWMMGLPPGFTDCGCSATAWSLYRRRMRSRLCGLLHAITRAVVDQGEEND